MRVPAPGGVSASHQQIQHDEAIEQRGRVGAAAVVDLAAGGLSEIPDVDQDGDGLRGEGHRCCVMVWAGEGVDRVAGEGQQDQVGVRPVVDYGYPHRGQRPGQLD